MNPQIDIKVFQADNGDCPYLKKRRWCSFVFYSDKLQPGIYESLLDQGFRRSGTVFYKNNCPNCKLCIPIKIPVDIFQISRSQKRALRLNQDIIITKEPLAFDFESFNLYKNFSKQRFSTEVKEDDYHEFLTQSAVDTMMMKYYLKGTLIGVGWVDILINALSSVYFAFDPEISKRSLGVFSLLKEIELAKSLNKQYLHLGFWIKSCQTMEYKAKYHPHLLLINEEWVHH